MLVIHIIIALISLAVTTWAALAPGRRKLTAGSWLFAATIGSGVALALSSRQQLLHVCLSGLVYSAAIAALTYTATRRLAASRQS